MKLADLLRYLGKLFFFIKVVFMLNLGQLTVYTGVFQNTITARINTRKIVCTIEIVCFHFHSIPSANIFIALLETPIYLCIT